MRGWSARHGREKFVNIGGAFVSSEHWFLRRAEGLEPTEKRSSWSASRAREALRAELALMLRSSVSAGVQVDLLSLAVDPSSVVCNAPDRFMTFWECGTPLTREAKEVFDLAKELVKEFGELQEAALQRAKDARARAERWEQEERRASRIAGGEGAAEIARENVKKARADEQMANENADLFRRASHGTN
jgi:hypothetical protein